MNFVVRLFPDASSHMPVPSSVVRSPSYSAFAIVFIVVVCIVTRSSLLLLPCCIVVQSNHANKVNSTSRVLSVSLGAIVGYGAFLCFHLSSSFPVPLLRSLQPAPLLFELVSLSLYTFKMPSRTPSSEDSLPKKGALTLTRLVDYDDRITDALVDRVSTRRNLSSAPTWTLTAYRSTTGLPFASCVPSALSDLAVLERTTSHVFCRLM